MFGEKLPKPCDACGQDVATVFDHAEGCNRAAKIAEREIARIEDKPQGWPKEGDDELLERLEDVVDAANGGE